MTKADIVDNIHANSGLTKDEAFAYLETMLETIKKTLATEKPVKIKGYVNFVVKRKADRRGRNLQTCESITIAARKVLTFKPSTLLRQAINR